MTRLHRVPVCPYCLAYAKLVQGSRLFPALAKVAYKWFWRCDPCEAHVGCHPGTRVPLGSLASRNLRKARIEAHAVFDKTYSRGPTVRDFHTRSQAYEWLARKLDLTVEETHIARFDIHTCRRVVALCKELANKEKQ